MSSPFRSFFRTAGPRQDYGMVSAVVWGFAVEIEGVTKGMVPREWQGNGAIQVFFRVPRMAARAKKRQKGFDSVASRGVGYDVAVPPRPAMPDRDGIELGNLVTGETNVQCLATYRCAGGRQVACQ
jgi:hypothetical protein